MLACKKKNSVEPVDTKSQQICKKWRITAYYVNSVSVKLPTGDYIQFNHNQTYTERKYKVIVSGTWEWQKHQTQIKMNSGTWNVLTLSDNHLEMEKNDAQPSEKLVLDVF
ncbi:MAG: lipocalin family protein [Bacteroidia bacterium]|nr:lipocalin family protein [Bacteroidia bacterium]MDW8347242.1 lipocalin family protein [Bacteroidia bacterium]